MRSMIDIFLNENNPLELDIFLNESKENKLTKNQNFIHTKFGYCYYEFNSDRSVCLIFNLHVEKEYRRKGHAKHLLELTINEIRNYENYSGELYIEADPEENSISKQNLVRFYKKTGLILIDRRWIENEFNK